MNEMLNGRMAFPAYIVLAAVFLGVQSLQGLSFLDIGMYMSGYGHFADDPYACYYLGQWFLTYRLTAFLCDVFSADSFMGIRMLHLVINIVTQTAVWLYLRRHIEQKYIIPGLALATLAHFGSYTDINYNDYSTTLLVLAVMAYHAGLYCPRCRWLILLSGIVVGVAFFFRVVNLTFVLLPLSAILISRKYGATVGRRAQLTLFFAGTATGCAAVAGFALADGSMDILMMTANDLLTIGSDTDDPHNLKNILISAYTVYRGYISGFAPVAVLAALLMAAAGSRWSRAGRTAVSAVLAALIMLCIYFWEPSANITVGICLAALAVMLCAREENGSRSCLFVLSLLVPMVYPIGSNGGVVFFGQYLSYLPLPLALHVLSRGTTLLSERYGRSRTGALRTAYLAVCAAMIIANAKRPMMEDGTRRECLYTIDSDVARHIHTTKENADMYNRMIKEVKPLIPDGSYMICNFSTPMISIMGCKPYAVFSDVFTSDRMNDRYISVAYSKAGKGGELPYMLLDLKGMTEGFVHVRQTLHSISPYRRIWTDGRYELSAPVRSHNSQRIIQ